MANSPRNGTTIKQQIDGLEAPVFDTPAFASPPPLADATVAIVTSASLHYSDDDDFAVVDTSFRQLSSDRTDFRMGHWSQDVDHVGFALDYNVVFPIDRLKEMELAGTVGRVSDLHLAYAGNQFDVAGIRMDSGPEGAMLLSGADVDIVLLTPV